MWKLIFLKKIFKENSHLTMFLGIWNKIIFNRNKILEWDLYKHVSEKSTHLTVCYREDHQRWSTDPSREEDWLSLGRNPGWPSLGQTLGWGEGGAISHQKSHPRGLSKQCICLVLPFQTYSWLVDWVYLKEICCNPKTHLSVFWYELVEEGGPWLWFSELTWARRKWH